MDKQSSQSVASNKTVNMHVPIAYVEFAADNLPAIKQFYGAAFNWQFTDYGPEYTAFENAGISGGFYFAHKSADADKGSALIVLQTSNLEACLATVLACGGTLKTDIFSFPGGRRFHFLDPCNNELAVCCYE